MPSPHEDTVFGRKAAMLPERRQGHRHEDDPSGELDLDDPAKQAPDLVDDCIFTGLGRPSA